MARLTEDLPDRPTGPSKAIPVGTAPEPEPEPEPEAAVDEEIEVDPSLEIDARSLMHPSLVAAALQIKNVEKNQRRGRRERGEAVFGAALGLSAP